ncbi:RNA polymerase sigma factor [Cellulomonas alba]|uniref:Sigma-70 family RNA polymerase sigma factor n=1 Tax=Cellulomonas alba TaxID=3053467 RepID=A0ABT7SDT9_9CELL|nr:sigma-70 family RNA polymerase sigma factor [Cellulomonas alba]MDM7854349.1 sigma-70 family RNA polymerase sigma factor [Cellulomonas alba]
MSDDLVEPVDTALRDQGEGLADQAARAVLAYRDGDRGPLAALVQVMTPLLWHTVRAQGADSELAQDIVQNVWLTLVRDIESIRDPRATLQWMLVTAKRAAWRAVRRSRDEQVRQDSDEHATDWLTTPADDLPDAVAVRDERDRVLWGHVGELSDRCRRLLGLVAMVDRPDYAVVSRALGMPVGSIGPTRGRCLAKLRVALAADPAWSLS